MDARYLLLAAGGAAIVVVLWLLLGSSNSGECKAPQSYDVICDGNSSIIYRNISEEDVKMVLNITGATRNCRVIGNC